MNKIEKLGITPIEKKMEYVNCHGCGMRHELRTYSSKAIRKIEQQNNELLEALIRNLELNQRGYFMKEKILKDIIEKIAGIPWDEIKELFTK